MQRRTFLGLLAALPFVRWALPRRRPIYYAFDREKNVVSLDEFSRAMKRSGVFE